MGTAILYIIISIVLLFVLITYFKYDWNRMKNKEVSDARKIADAYKKIAMKELKKVEHKL